MKKKKKRPAAAQFVDPWEGLANADKAAADALRGVSIELEREIDIATIRHDADLIPGLRLALEIVDR